MKCQDCKNFVTFITQKEINGQVHKMENHRCLALGLKWSPGLPQNVIVDCEKYGESESSKRLREMKEAVKDLPQPVKLARKAVIKRHKKVLKKLAGPSRKTKKRGR